MAGPAASGTGAVFLDRDGTISMDLPEGYLHKPDDLVLITGAAVAIRRLNGRGVKVIIITNQSGVGRGYFKEEDVQKVNARLEALLSVEGAHIDGIYYCIHRPDEDCSCRKPQSDLVIRAAGEHGVDLARSFVVGDKASDVELAWRSGAKGVLVMTGLGPAELEKMARRPDHVAPRLIEAVDWILGEMEREE
ncbi:MAG: HAD family hydrolase [Thermodesulfobacteriota bacterium]|nr:MAG: HAD family hydrolase [Thermodesulfobacteriota bacterium]